MTFRHLKTKSKRKLKQPSLWRACLNNCATEYAVVELLIMDAYKRVNGVSDEQDAGRV